jgi:hypothetical protein
MLTVSTEGAGGRAGVVEFRRADDAYGYAYHGCKSHRFAVAVVRRGRRVDTYTALGTPGVRPWHDAAEESHPWRAFLTGAAAGAIVGAGALLGTACAVAGDWPVMLAALVMGSGVLSRRG